MRPSSRRRVLAYWRAGGFELAARFLQRNALQHPDVLVAKSVPLSKASRFRDNRDARRLACVLPPKLGYGSSMADMGEGSIE